MTGEKFVELCFKEKEASLCEYFSTESETDVGCRIRELIKSGTNKEDLYALISSVMNESFYALLMAIDGEASLSGVQMCYKLYDEDNNLLNECGEIEEAAYTFFMEE